MLLSDSITKKFLETFVVSDYEILTDTGWKTITHTNKTIEYEVYEITTESGRRIRCADNHILFDDHYNEVFAKDTLHRLVMTESGAEKVIEVVKTGIHESMYDLTVESKEHRYYTNGFLSHNTSVMAAVFCHYIIFNEGKVCAILANKSATAREILERVKKAYEYLPDWMKHGVKEWNKGSIWLDNDSRILASATSSSAIRGYSINVLFLDEFAFVPNNIADEFFTSVYPTISSGMTSKLVMISTPNGMNHFYKFWMEALDGSNGMAHVLAKWDSVPNRSQKWADQQKSILGDVKFAQEMEVEFIGSSNTLISGSKLKSIPTKKPIFKSETLSVYEKPQKNKAYVMTVDVSRGVGLDYSAIVVVDVSDIPYRVVARYRDNKISTTLFPGLIHKLAIEYNNASVLVETNDMGESVVNSLFYDYEYELTLMAKGDKITSWGGQGTRPGVRTTIRSKRVGCDALKQMVETNKLEINDLDILYELSNFVVKGRSYAADNGNDDLAMCLVLLGYLTTQPSMQDISTISLKERIIEERMKQAEEEMIPIGFLTDGSELEDTVPFNF